MKNYLNPEKRLCVLSGLSGVTGVILLMVSFAIDTSPPAGATTSALIRWVKRIT